jgi:hypothetical protein
MKSMRKRIGMLTVGISLLLALGGCGGGGGGNPGLGDHHRLVGFWTLESPGSLVVLSSGQIVGEVDDTTPITYINGTMESTGNWAIQGTRDGHFVGRLWGHVTTSLGNAAYMATKPDNDGVLMYMVLDGTSTRGALAGGKMKVKDLLQR